MVKFDHTEVSLRRMNRWKEQAMKYASTEKNGAARDEALKRRNGTKREVLRLKPMPNEQAENPIEPRDKKTSE
jgi:hypothetical protein